MKRLLAFLLVVLFAAVAAFLFVRQANPPRAPIARFLPAETIFLAHLADVEKTRDDFRRTDLYALWQEPAVKDFLRKPTANLPRGAAELTDDLAHLRARDVFAAVTNLDPLRVVGGFEFRCSAREARDILEKAVARWAPGAEKRIERRGAETFEIWEKNSLSLATIFRGDHFYFASNTDELAGCLARSVPSLAQDPHYLKVMAELPAPAALIFFFQPAALAKKIPRPNGFEHLDGAGYAISIEGAKFREVGFAATPKRLEVALQHDTLSLASSDALFYFASLADGSWFGNAPPPAKFGRFSSDDFRAAFGPELSALCDWPATARIPSLLLTFPVRDANRAATMAAAWAETNGWQKSVNGKVTYYRAPLLPLLAIAQPTLVLSAQKLACGSDRGVVDRAIAGTAAPKPLTTTGAYRDAMRPLPEAEQTLAYLDLGALYQRFDTFVRPILQMTSALAPGVNNTIDAGKLPPAEVVARHLTPCALVRRYVHGGYRTESIGSVTFGQAIGLPVAAFFAAQHLRDFSSRPTGATPVPPPASLSPVPAPGATVARTP